MITISTSCSSEDGDDGGTSSDSVGMMSSGFSVLRSAGPGVGGRSVHVRQLRGLLRLLLGNILDKTGSPGAGRSSSPQAVSPLAEGRSVRNPVGGHLHGLLEG
jgi:hypothetical protein